MIDTRWNVEKLDWTTNTGGVYAAYWRANATDGVYSAKREGVVEFEPNPNSPDFVDISEVTEELALTWVFTSVDKDALESDLADEIHDLANPSQVSGRPWDNVIFSQQ